MLEGDVNLNWKMDNETRKWVEEEVNEVAAVKDKSPINLITLAMDMMRIFSSSDDEFIEDRGKVWVKFPLHAVKIGNKIAKGLGLSKLEANTMFYMHGVRDWEEKWQPKGTIKNLTKSDARALVDTKITNAETLSKNVTLIDSFSPYFKTLKKIEKMEREINASSRDIIDISFEELKGYISRDLQITQERTTEDPGWEKYLARKEKVLSILLKEINDRHEKILESRARGLPCLDCGSLNTFLDGNSIKCKDCAKQHRKSAYVKRMSELDAERVDWERFGECAVHVKNS